MNWLRSSRLPDHPETYDAEAIELVGDEIRAPIDLDVDHARHTASRSVLAGFAGLHDRGPEEVLDFAKQHGLLGLCACGLPFAHGIGGCSPQRSVDRSYFVEDVRDWLTIAEQAFALIALIGQVREGPGERRHWDTLDAAPRGDRSQALWAEAGQWVAAADIGLSIGPLDGQPTLQGRWLFGTLAIELVQAVRTMNIAVCAGCLGVYWRERAPKRGQKNWCSSCRESGVRSKYAKRRG